LSAHFHKFIAVSIQSVAAASLNGFCLFQAKCVSLVLFGGTGWDLFYQQQKTVKPGPLNGWIKLDTEKFLQIEVIHQILWKERSQAGASTMVLDSLCGWVRVRSSSKNQGRQSCCPSRGIRFPSRQSGEVSFLSDRCDEILRLSALRL